MSGVALGGALGLSGCTPPDQSPAGRFVAMLRIIEAQMGGALGAELFDTQTGLSIGLNSGMRFGHCSSFKLSLAALVLARNAASADDADRIVTWEESDLMFVSPFTTERLNEGASLRELAEFTQKYSDNAAANILLREVGGPAALTAFWQSISDGTSRLDRIEPHLNNVPSTEIRDTTTPSAMARTVAKLIYGDVLPDAEKATLRQWMVDTSTGTRRVRAGLPSDWRAGDKTGTSIWPGMGSLYVDIGFVENPSRGPITFATYLRMPNQSDGIDPAAEAALAQVGEVLTKFAKEPGMFPI
ncbi:MAG: class A beta-lactamase [Erythrobacter sp.]